MYNQEYDSDIAAFEAHVDELKRVEGPLIMEAYVFDLCGPKRPHPPTITDLEIEEFF